MPTHAGDASNDADAGWSALYHDDEVMLPLLVRMSRMLTVCAVHIIVGVTNFLDQ